MASSEPKTELELSMRLNMRIDQHKEEVAQLREEFGDPQEALFSFTRDRFDVLSLFPSARQRDGQMIDWDDDDLDAW